MLIEGIPLIGFIYYLEFKRRMYLLEKVGPKSDPPCSPREKKLVKGLFFVLAGLALIILPGTAGLLGLGIALSFEMLMIGAIAMCAGLAFMASCGILKMKGLWNESDGFGMR